VITQIRSDGIATLIVDRNYRQVAEHADRLLVLQKGQVGAQRQRRRAASRPGVDAVSVGALKHLP
jgi:branched-chain amino acid transport system ATP-binding protein